MIRMVVSDLDGTLLRDDKSLSPRTRAALRRCREIGIRVAYATGRGGSAERRAPSDLFDGRITMNGALAFVGGASVYSRLIPWQVARPVLVACDRRGLQTTSEYSGTHYANFAVSDVWPDITSYQKIDPATHARDAEKLYALIRAPEDAAFIEDLLPEELYLTVSREGLGQIMHREATKSRAIAALARLWGIAASEIAAFGDDLNDIDMLAYAGAGVAVANARDEVRAISRQTCPSNEDDGPAMWIEDNILNA